MKIIRLLSLLFLSASASAQIPNADFESWTTVGAYSSPDGWDNTNAMTSSMSIYTCTRGGTSGASFLQLTTQNVSGMGVVPGITTCGTLDMTNTSAPSPSSGFAFTQRPQAMAGKWQYMASGSDRGYISATLTRWNPAAMKRDTIATSHNALFNMVMSWANFSISFNYTSQLFPDTAFITLSASGTTPVANSYLYVDSLHFTGSVVGSSGINENSAADLISVFPNPSSDIVRIRFDASQSSNCDIQLINAEGAVMREVKGMETKEYNMPVADLAKGLYILRIASARGIVSKRIAIL